MMRYLLCVLLMGTCLPAWSAGLVKNADFSAEAPGRPNVPADWTLPADGAWQLEAPAGSEVRPALFYALAAAQLPLLELTPLHLSLEDVFLRLTTAEAAGHG